MKFVTTFLLCVALGNWSYAFPFNPPPLPDQLRSMKDHTAPFFVRFSHDLRLRLPSSTNERRQILLKTIDACVKFIPDYYLPRATAALEEKNAAALADAIDGLHIALIELRESVDELLVEAMADRTLKADDKFLDDVREFWRLQSASRSLLKFAHGQYAAAQDGNKPDKALEPTPSPVTSPAAREPRQP